MTIVSQYLHYKFVWFAERFQMAGLKRAASTVNSVKSLISAKD